MTTVGAVRNHQGVGGAELLLHTSGPEGVVGTLEGNDVGGIGGGTTHLLVKGVEVREDGGVVGVLADVHVVVSVNHGGPDAGGDVVAGVPDLPEGHLAAALEGPEVTRHVRYVASRGRVHVLVELQELSNGVRVVGREHVVVAHLLLGAILHSTSIGIGEILSEVNLGGGVGEGEGSEELLVRNRVVPDGIYCVEGGLKGLDTSPGEDADDVALVVGVVETGVDDTRGAPSSLEAVGVSHLEPGGEGSCVATTGGYPVNCLVENVSLSVCHKVVEISQGVADGKSLQEGHVSVVGTHLTVSVPAMLQSEHDGPHRVAPLGYES